MPRALRYQYPGALHHVIARGDGGKEVFETDGCFVGGLFLSPIDAVVLLRQ